jgi:hypothetical protein
VQRIYALSIVLLFGCGAEPEADEPYRAPPAAEGPEPSMADWVGQGHAVGPGHQAHSTELPPGHPPIAGHGGGHAHDAPPPAPTIEGTVRETMDAASYTYMQLETSDGLVWIASNRTEVSVGDRVEASGSEMRDFRSSTLDRTFDRLVLASYVRINGAPIE